MNFRRKGQQPVPTQVQFGECAHQLQQTGGKVLQSVVGQTHSAAEERRRCRPPSGRLFRATTVNWICPNAIPEDWREWSRHCRELRRRFSKVISADVGQLVEKKAGNNRSNSQLSVSETSIHLYQNNDKNTLMKQKKKQE